MNGGTDGSLVVLIVDDDPVCRLFCARALASAGYQTITAGDGFTAIEKAVERKPGVILLDMHLPAMSGIRTVRSLLNCWPEAKGNVRIIGLSGDDSGNTHAAMQRAGFTTVLRKPFRRKALLNAVGTGGNDRPDERDYPRGHQCDFGPDSEVLACGRLQAAFRNELLTQIPTLDHSITSLDWRQAGEILHRLSGAAALAGHATLSGCGRRLLQQLQRPWRSRRLAQAYLEFLRQATGILNGWF